MSVINSLIYITLTSPFVLRVIYLFFCPTTITYQGYVDFFLHQLFRNRYIRVLHLLFRNGGSMLYVCGVPVCIYVPGVWQKQEFVAVEECTTL
jgi:hypothetical protein